MHFVYLTSKKYPAKTADHFFAKEMAEAYQQILKDDFSLILADDSSKYFKDIRVVSAGLKLEKGRSIYYFFWLAYFIFKNRENISETVFFSNDPNLAVDLILLRKIFRFKYRICFEWHMLFDNWRDRFIVTNSDQMVATSERLRGTILKRTGVSVSKDRFKVVYGGVNLPKYEGFEGRDLKSELGLPKNDFLVAYIGLFRTLGTTKGVDTMVEALKYLPQNVKMVFVGGKKEEIEDYKKQIGDAEILNRCIFVEKQDIEKVPMYQKAIDILVIPSPDKPPFNNYLLPMKVYEYLASKKPIIYSDLPILKEVLGDCGYSFAPDNAEDLAKQIGYVINSTAEEVSMKTKLCYDKASRSSWLKRAEAIINFVER